MKNSEMNFWENKFYSACRFIWYAGAELVDGIWNNRVDVVRYVYPGVFVALLLLVRVDYALSYLTGADYFNLPATTREWLAYFALFGGWIAWAGIQAYYRVTYFARLKRAFTDSGLKAGGKLPAFIEDKPIDEHVRRMRLKVDGITLKSFQEAKEKLESHFNCSIIRLSEEGGDKSRINIYYAAKPLTTEAVLDDVGGFKDSEIPVGVSHEGPITANLKDVAHILAAGQTGGGKSNFEKVVTTVLTVNNPDAEVVYLDFKGGMEIADLVNKLGEEHKNFFKYEDQTACARYLAQLGGKLESRFSEIARLGASNLDDYLKKRAVEISKSKASGEEATNKDEPPKRLFLVIDEISELYSKKPILPKDELLAARAAVNRIARQGRAAGIHMIVATQKPDASSFDQTLKANMPAVLCFPTPTIAASISALGAKRAVDLDPAIKGRAVWKYGPKVLEIQTYLFQ